MPGHFTHIYTARRVADWLTDADSFNPLDESAELAAVGSLLGGLDGLTPQRCAQLMHTWPKYTNVGAIGPDLFFFCQDYSSGPLAAAPYEDDLLMLAMAVYYWIDAAKDDKWEPLLILLAEVNQTFARIVRLLIQLKKLWDAFIEKWNETIGPIVKSIDTLIDDVTGGIVSETQVAFDELLTGIEKICEEELLSFRDVFSWFSLKMRQGWDEKAFVWSDMLHYRNTTLMARNLFAEARRQYDAADPNDPQRGERLEQFQAFALGWICHIGTDVVAHSFVNEQCGGPFRTHWQRHHVVENHIDAWNYRQTGAGGALTADPDMAWTDQYPDVARSALVFAVALDDEHPNGWDRPDLSVFADDDQAGRNNAVDHDGEMPDWLADGIVRALIATYHDTGLPEPENLGGKPFQDALPTVHDALSALLDAAGISVDRPLGEVIDAVAPTPDFDVPPGYPLPWEVKVSYRFMISYYRLAFWGGFDLDKPRAPQVVLWPPASDFSDLASAPDLTGVSSDDPVDDVCDAIKSLLDWFKKEIDAAGQLFGDIVKMLTSPASYPLRWLLYQAAMYGWDLITNVHEILSHTGFLLPHGEMRYDDDGELRQPSDIDEALIQLGNTVDGAFAQALADAHDPFGNLDLDPSLLGQPHDPRQEPYPYLPVRAAQLHTEASNEYRRPWAYPATSRDHDGKLYDTPGEQFNRPAELLDAGITGERVQQVLRVLGQVKGTVSGPYPMGALPHQVLFRVTQPIQPGQRADYEDARSPAETDFLNERYIGRDPRTDHSPLGDPIPFAAYLMGRVLDPKLGYDVDFNLDADPGYGYKCWDWIRGTQTGTNDRGQAYLLPVVPPEGSDKWSGAAPDAVQQPVELHYLPERAQPPIDLGGIGQVVSIPAAEEVPSEPR